jgi:light-regulated signal transduction histidine kinase (bacteriophytochrome)
MDVPPEEWSERYGVYLPDQVTPYPPDQLPLARAIRGESVDGDEQFLRHAKVPHGIWLSVTGRPLIDESGTLRGGVVVFNDITARKRTEEEIKKLNEDLNRRALELEAANKELESFSYSVSHDLRAPLRAIDGFSLALLEDYADKLDPQGKDYLQRVRTASQRMAQLIDDILNLSRVTRYEMRRERVNMSELVRTIADELKKSEPEREVEFVITQGVIVEGDARLLHIALENLLTNAWKFTGKNQRARIEFGVKQLNGKSVCYVRDDGVGFDMAYATKLFGAFQRLHAVTEFPGTGIGLATMQRIIHRHGGRVWAEGEVGKGATFYFVL